MEPIAQVMGFFGSLFGFGSKVAGNLVAQLLNIAEFDMA